MGRTKSGLFRGDGKLAGSLANSWGAFTATPQLIYGALRQISCYMLGTRRFTVRRYLVMADQRLGRNLIVVSESVMLSYSAHCCEDT